ncbi:MAG: oligopeptide transporter, OPT family [Candidatus Marinimicrobia bacterium]|nr:oligopeptide transporter, OPT family [Candidatus Neomarinimicrobiota bacterium]
MKPLPEITVKAVILGIFLSVLLAGANAYLGLFAGMTVSASIPAAVISMGILRAFKNSNILENNIVQTAASAGESLAAGVIFTIPALLLMGEWSEFNFADHYWTVTGIAMTGGLIGVLFTIPLRRALIVEEGLHYPEGVATAEVLKSGEEGAGKLMMLAQAAVIGGLFKFMAEEGLRLWSSQIAWAKSVGSSFISFQVNLSPALLAVGYIVGFNISMLVFGGGVIGRWIFLPALAPTADIPPEILAGSAVDSVNWLHSNVIRYIGVGSMIVGGLWALINLRSALGRGLESSMETYRKLKMHGAESIERTEMDIPLPWVLIGIGASIVPVFAIYLTVVHSIAITAIMVVFMLIAGFIFSAVAGYMAGLVGSSNNPISGVTIATILSASLLLYGLKVYAGADVGPAAAIFIGAVVCCAAAIGGDNLQDLKAGYILGATPWKQQVMQVVGVVSAAFVMMPVLWLLHSRYGIGMQVHPGVTPLEAPQAALMANIANGVFNQNLPWNLIIMGALLAVAIIVLDKTLEKRGSGFRTPVLAVAVGLYLPFHLVVAIGLGGLIAYLTSGNTSLHSDETNQDGLLYSAGLITGEALVGIGLAVPLMIAEFTAWKSIPTEFYMFDAAPLGPWPGALILMGISYMLYKTAKNYQSPG